MDIEQFKSAAPDHFLSGIEDPHELQLQRLAFEKFQRQELVMIQPGPLTLQRHHQIPQHHETSIDIVAPFSSGTSRSYSCEQHLLCRLDLL